MPDRRSSSLRSRLRTQPLVAVMLLVLASAALLVACNGTASQADALPTADTGTSTAPTPVEGSWPEYRGPQRDGKSPATGLLHDWPDAGPKMLWRTEVGGGYSGLSIAQGRLFTLYSRGDGEFAGAFDTASGERVWEQRLDAVFRNQFGDGPRSTPTIDGDTVYALGAQGQLYALGVQDGEERWHVDLIKTFGARIPTWGISMAPLVEGDLLLVDVGGAGSNSIVALNKKTGETVWTTSAGRDDGAGYSAPLPIEVDGVRQIVFFLAAKVVGVAPADGRVLWQHDWRTDYDVNAATPIFIAPNRLFVASGYSTGAALLELQRGEGDGFSVREVWNNPRMRNQFSSSILLGDHLYGFDNKTLKCIRVSDGEQVWAERGLGHGSLVYADGYLYVLGERGQLVLVEATPEGYKEQDRLQLFDSKTWTMPTLVGDRLFVRDEEVLVSLQIG